MKTADLNRLAQYAKNAVIEANAPASVSCAVVAAIKELMRLTAGRVEDEKNHPIVLCQQQAQRAIGALLVWYWDEPTATAQNAYNDTMDVLEDLLRNCA